MRKLIPLFIIVLLTVGASATTHGSGNFVKMDNLEFEGEPVLGEEDAEVTMVMYEDFQCPFCKRFETQTFPKIESNFVDSGEVKVVWKDFPAPSLGHDWAEPAAAAMECTYRHGGNEAFWEVKDKLFEEAQTLTRGEEKFSPENIQDNIIQYADNQGANTSEIRSCIENENPLEEVKEDKQGILEATENIGTPTAIINGKKVVGAQPYPQFKSAIETAQNEGFDREGEDQEDSNTDKPGESEDQEDSGIDNSGESEGQDL